MAQPWQRIKALQEALDKKEEDFAKLDNAFWTLVSTLYKKKVLDIREAQKIRVAHDEG